MFLKKWLNSGSLKRKFAESDGKHGQSIKYNENMYGDYVKETKTLKGWKY